VHLEPKDLIHLIRGIKVFLPLVFGNYRLIKDNIIISYLNNIILTGKTDGTHYTCDAPWW
jgi:hypothetical protein